MKTIKAKDRWKNDWADGERLTDAGWVEVEGLLAADAFEATADVFPGENYVAVHVHSASGREIEIRFEKKRGK